MGELRVCGRVTSSYTIHCTIVVTLVENPFINREKGRRNVLQLQTEYTFKLCHKMGLRERMEVWVKNTHFKVIRISSS